MRPITTEAAFRAVLRRLRASPVTDASRALVARAPGRLDVMGGVADYSGSVVLEGTLDLAAWVAIEPRDDGQVVAFSRQASGEGWDPQVSMQVGVLANADYPTLRAEFARDPRRRWAAYVLGVVAVLAREGVAQPPEGGMSLAVHSDVPLGAGVSSSAALEVASMSAVKRLIGCELRGLELARLCQIVENHIAGAPCGIMDQVTSALGDADALLALKCQPHEVLGNLRLPPQWHVYGINSAVKHAVGGGKYTRARVGAFMGLTIIQRALKIKPEGGYLCNVTPADYVARIRAHLPAKMRGSEFRAAYGETPDTVTRVLDGVVYSVRGCSEHPIYENDRVQRFIALMQDGGRRAAILAGRLMYGSHWSYGNRAGLGCAETDLIVRLVKERGEHAGLMGAKITGGGSGGTVAVLTYGDTRQTVQEVADTYERLSGHRPHVFAGSSPGALAWGV